MHCQLSGLVRTLMLVFTGAMTLSLGCGSAVGPSGRTVGRQCTSDRDCEVLCLTGDDNYPGGMCTLRCASDRDCPPGSRCVDENGGICVTECRSTEDCAGFGRGYVCDGRRLRGGVGDALVCRVP